MTMFLEAAKRGPVRIQSVCTERLIWEALFQIDLRKDASKRS